MTTPTWSSYFSISAWSSDTMRDNAWGSWVIDVCRLRAFLRAAVSEVGGVGRTNLSFQQSGLEVLVQTHKKSGSQCQHSRRKYLNACQPIRYFLLNITLKTIQWIPKWQTVLCKTNKTKHVSRNRQTGPSTDLKQPTVNSSLFFAELISSRWKIIEIPVALIDTSIGLSMVWTMRNQD